MDIEWLRREVACLKVRRLTPALRVSNQAVKPPIAKAGRPVFAETKKDGAVGRISEAWDPAPFDETAGRTPS